MLEELENKQIYPTTFQTEVGRRLGLMVAEREAGMREGQHRNLWKSCLKHKWWIRILEFVIGICFFSILFSPAHEVRQDQVAGQQKQTQQITAAPDILTRADVQTLHDEVIRIERLSRGFVYAEELRALSDQLSNQRDIILETRKSIDFIKQNLLPATRPEQPASSEKQ